MTRSHTFVIRSNDIMFQSRIRATVIPGGGEVILWSSAAEIEPDEIIILDCNHDTDSQLAIISSLRETFGEALYIIGVCSHVNAALRVQLREKGVTRLATNGSVQRVLSRYMQQQRIAH